MEWLLSDFSIWVVVALIASAFAAGFIDSLQAVVG